MKQFRVIHAGDSTFIISKQLMIIPGFDIRLLDARIADRLLNCIPVDSDRIQYDEHIEGYIESVAFNQDEKSFRLLEAYVATHGRYITAKPVGGDSAMLLH